MAPIYNALGQPIGPPLPGWAPPPPPPRTPMAGRFCRVEPLDPARHAADLHAAYAADAEGRMWTYLGYGPFAGPGDYRAWAEGMAPGADPLLHAIVDLATSRAVGVAAYLRIDPRPAASRSATWPSRRPSSAPRRPREAMALMMRRAFGLGYRRYEWKCDALNAPSRAAAQRLGLSFEGVFRQATVYKGRSRDTAWYAAIDREWPALAGGLRPLARPGQLRRRRPPARAALRAHRAAAPPAGLIPRESSGKVEGGIVSAGGDLPGRFSGVVFSRSTPPR